VRKPWKYRGVSTSTLRVQLRVLDIPGLRWAFGDQIADIKTELLARELPLLAEESGGWLVSAPEGIQ
jgi:hypothetical protein